MVADAELLSIDKGASSDEVKKAYRKVRPPNTDQSAYSPWNGN